jgi:hypothetical protein
MTAQEVLHAVMLLDLGKRKGGDIEFERQKVKDALAEKTGSAK